MDILEALGKIEHYTAGMTLDTFRADVRTVDAVAHNLTVLSEAARLVPADVRARHPEVPWAQMRAVRNVLVHEYPSVELETVWRTLRDDLPALAPLLRALLDQEA